MIKQIASHVVVPAAIALGVVLAAAHLGSDHEQSQSPSPNRGHVAHVPGSVEYSSLRGGPLSAKAITARVTVVHPDTPTDPLDDPAMWTRDGVFRGTLPGETPQEELLRKVIEPYEEEVREAGWAAQVERTLQGQVSAYMAQHPESSVRLVDLKCRSSRCMVELTFGDIRAARDGQEALFTRQVMDLPGCALHSLGVDDHDLAPTQAFVFHCSNPSGAIAVRETE